MQKLVGAALAVCLLFQSPYAESSVDHTTEARIASSAAFSQAAIPPRPLITGTGYKPPKAFALRTTAAVLLGLLIFTADPTLIVSESKIKVDKQTVLVSAKAEFDSKWVLLQGAIDSAGNSLGLGKAIARAQPNSEINSERHKSAVEQISKVAAVSIAGDPSLQESDLTDELITLRQALSAFTQARQSLDTTEKSAQVTANAMANSKGKAEAKANLLSMAQLTAQDLAEADAKLAAWQLKPNAAPRQIFKSNNNTTYVSGSYAAKKLTFDGWFVTNPHDDGNLYLVEDMGRYVLARHSAQIAQGTPRKIASFNSLLEMHAVLDKFDIVKAVGETLETTPSDAVLPSDAESPALDVSHEVPKAPVLLNQVIFDALKDLYTSKLPEDKRLEEIKKRAAKIAHDIELAVPETPDLTVHAQAALADRAALRKRFQETRSEHRRTDIPIAEWDPIITNAIATGLNAPLPTVPETRTQAHTESTQQSASTTKPEVNVPQPKAPEVVVPESVKKMPENIKKIKDWVQATVKGHLAKDIPADVLAAESSLREALISKDEKQAKDVLAQIAAAKILSTSEKQMATAEKAWNEFSESHPGENFLLPWVDRDQVTSTTMQKLYFRALAQVKDQPIAGALAPKWAEASSMMSQLKTSEQEKNRLVTEAGGAKSAEMAKWSNDLEKRTSTLETSIQNKFSQFAEPSKSDHIIMEGAKTAIGVSVDLKHKTDGGPAILILITYAGPLAPNKTFNVDSQLYVIRFQNGNLTYDFGGDTFKASVVPEAKDDALDRGDNLKRQFYYKEAIFLDQLPKLERLESPTKPHAFNHGPSPVEQRLLATGA